MYITNVTEIRQNANKIIARVVEEKEPTIVLHRSKPVAYIVEASTYENLQRKLEEAEKLEKVGKTKLALQNISLIRERMAQKAKQPDSTPLILELREGYRDE